MNFLLAAKTILELLPAIINTVKTIEEAFPAGGSGKQKLELVRATLQATYDNVEDKVGQFDTLWKIIAPVVGSVVTFANSVGLFKKTA